MSHECHRAPSRVAAATRQVAPESLPLIELGQLEEIQQQLREVIHDYNFDTFSFLFEVLQEASHRQESLSEALLSMQLDSAKLAIKYQGSNCAGLSMTLQRKLQARTIRTLLIPAYGSYLISEEADAYVQVRTTELLGLVQTDASTKEALFLAPGLTIDVPMLVRKGSIAQNYGSRHVIVTTDVEGFAVVSTRPDGSAVERRFRFEELLNPDQSLQKNMLRARTVYQITRQHKAGGKSAIVLDLRQKLFRVSIDRSNSAFDVKGFGAYVVANSQKLEEVFRNPFLGGGLLTLLEKLSIVKDELLLPGIRSILEHSWKSC